MLFPLRRAIALLAFAGALGAHGSAYALFDDEEARKRIEQVRKQLDERMTKLEAEAADRRALVDLSSQIDALRADVARMRGQMEVLLNQMQMAEKRQKDLYLDIDTRLRKIEQPNGPGAGGERPAGAEVTPAETKAYESALNHFKLGKYSAAIGAFQGFLASHPSSPLAPSAQYWIGNAHYARRDYRGAIAAQQKLLLGWPTNSKAPDAMLNIASSQEAMGNAQAAKNTLQSLVDKFPGSPAAASARQRIGQGPRR